MAKGRRKRSIGLFSLGVPAVLLGSSAGISRASRFQDLVSPVEPREMRVRVAIFILAVAVRVVFNIQEGIYLNVDSGEMAHVSRSLALHCAYADPFEAMPTGPTAHVMPAVPLIRGTILRIFGDAVQGIIVQQAISTVVTSTSYALLPYAAVSLGIPVESGVIAGIVGAVIPLQPYTEVSGNWDNPYGGLILLLFAAYTARLIRKGLLQLSDAWRYGLLAGVGLLFSASLALVFGGFLVIISGQYLAAGRWRGRLLHCIRFGAVACFICMAVLFPWALRNRTALGSWVWLRDNFGLELWVSNNPLAAPDFTTNSKRALFHPNGNRSEALTIVRVGEVRYSQNLRAQAFDWILRNPKGFAILTLQRIGLWWFPTRARGWRSVLFGAITILAALGLAHFARRDSKSAAVVACIWMLYPLVYYLIQFSPRYRYPIEWSLWLMVGVMAQAVLVRSGKIRTSQSL